MQQQATEEVCDASGQTCAAVQDPEGATLQIARYRSLDVEGQPEIDGLNAQAPDGLKREGSSGGPGQTGKEIAQTAHRQAGYQHWQGGPTAAEPGQCEETEEDADPGAGVEKGCRRVRGAELVLGQEHQGHVIDRREADNNEESHGHFAKQRCAPNMPKSGARLRQEMFLTSRWWRRDRESGQ